MKKKYPKIYPLFFLFLSVVHLAFLYYIKYHNQHLSLSEFSLKNIGNVFNLVVILCLFVGIIFYFKRKHGEITSFLYLMLISTLTLLLAYLLTIIKLPQLNFYFLGQSGDKLIKSAVFTLYEIFLLVTVSFTWLTALRADKEVYIKSFSNALIVIFFMLVSTFIYILVNGYPSDKWTLTKSDKNLAVVLGAAVWSDNQPSTSLSGRVDKGIQLYVDKFVGAILLTGSNAPGEMSEAEVALEYARVNGMDMEKVSYESSTTSTSEQLMYIKTHLAGDENINDIIVVSDSYHLVRIIEISKFLNINIKVAASSIYLDYKKKLLMQLRESIALVVFWVFAL